MEIRIGILLVAALFPLLAMEASYHQTSAFSGQVINVSIFPVGSATVHLIPTTAIDMTPITASDVYYPPYPAEAYDEPLEDAIRANGPKFPQAITDSEGNFSISNVPDGKYFIHVTPAAEDTSHLPGGDKSRQAYAAEELRGQFMTIRISGRPSPEATYIGSTACLDCHLEKENWKQTGHKLSWTPMGVPGPMQDHSRFPEFFESLESFKEVEEYTEGTHLELGDYDSKRGNDKFKIRTFEDPHMPIDTVYADLHLWKSNDDEKYYITMVNRLNPQDPNSPSHLEVKMTYGGAVHQQRFITAVPSNLGERQGWYTVLQYNPGGNDARWNRLRRVWKDYKFNYYWDNGQDGEYGTEDDLITAPPVNNNAIQTMCAGCHITGYERYEDPETGQVLVRAVNDPNGSLNIDDDPEMDEINIGCETCHGPGSEHTAADGNFYDIVSPQLLSSERETVLCGRCHDRRTGTGGPTMGYTQAIDEAGVLMRPGGSRHSMITEYSDPKKKGPAPAKDIWNDDVHSKKSHQQYPDFYKSTMYKNDRLLVTCSDCHDMHGETPYSRWLIHDPDDQGSPLCQRCHEVEINSHMSETLNAQMKGKAQTHCIDCHMPATSIIGGEAGRYARFIQTPPYTDAAEEKQNAYWEGHINSHVFDVPFKSNVDVRGVAPGEAMPIPYTNSCGTCHVVDELQYN